MKCKRCRFWVKDDPKDKDGMDGWCKRRSPTVCLGDEQQTGLWPLTLDLHWCGEFELKGQYKEQL